MTPVFEQKKLILYKNILKPYPPEIKNYVLARALNHQDYVPDLTTAIKLSKGKMVKTRLWFDLHRPGDLYPFVSSKFEKFAKEFVPKADIIIVSADAGGSCREFFLEFSNKKIDLIKDIIKSLQRYFSCDFAGIAGRIRRIRGHLDRRNYFMCGIKYVEDKIEEMKFCFNVDKEALLSVEIPECFFPLLDKFSARQFRGERSYLVDRKGGITSKAGWMVNSDFLPNFDIFSKALDSFPWTAPLTKKLNLCAAGRYALLLRWGWFSYLYSGKDINGIELMFNYNDGT